MRIALLLALSLLVNAAPAQAKDYDSWRAIVSDMALVLEEAHTAWLAQGTEAGKELINKAYFEFYEKLGVERAVLAYVSGKRASAVEYQFAAVKRLMENPETRGEVRPALDDLIRMLQEDAAALDGDGEEKNPWTIFAASLFILLREGVEAILVIAAITAWLERSGNARLNRAVYAGSLVAIAASLILALGLNKIFALSGAGQETLEGLTMLLAAVVLFFVSNWMLSKANTATWNKYIRDKAALAASSGSAIALTAAAFLAVFREGAETVLFYQALLTDAGERRDMLWLGAGVAALGLVLIFFLIRFGSLRLPLRPFFIGTSFLMGLMAVSFAGGGVKELQEADLVTVTPVGFVQSLDLLGIYPTVETLLPQAAILLLAAASFIFHLRPGRAKQ